MWSRNRAGLYIQDALAEFVPDMKHSILSPPAQHKMYKQKLINNCLIGFGAGKATLEPTFPHTAGVDCDGSTEYLQNSADVDLDFANDFTVGAWVRFDVVDNGWTVMQIKPSGSNQNRISFRNAGGVGKWNIVLYDSAGVDFKEYTTSTAVLSTATEYFLALTWDGTNLILYRNGVAETLTKNIDNAGTMDNTDTRTTAIMANVGGGALLNGDIATAYIWSETLSDADLLALYDSGNGNEHDARTSIGAYTNTATLQHYWVFGNRNSPQIASDEGVGNKVDLIGAAVDITNDDIIVM